MKYETITEDLIRSIPTIRERYLDELNFWDGEDPGPHNVFGDILNPYIKELLITQQKNEIIIKIFNFLEIMAQSDDEKVKEVLACTVLESLGDNKDILRTAINYMGKYTKKMSNEVEVGLGRKTDSEINLEL